MRGYLRLFHLQLISMIIVENITSNLRIYFVNTINNFTDIFVSIFNISDSVWFTKDQQDFVTQSDSLAQRNSLCTTVNLLTSLQN